MRPRVIAALAGALHIAASPKYALAGATGVTAAVTSSALGFDPLAWGIGGLGGAFLYLRGKPVGRPEAIANAMLSILLGGMASPICYASAAARWVELASVPGQYVIAIVLSFGWPPLSRLAGDIIRMRFGGSSGGSVQ